MRGHALLSFPLKGGGLHFVARYTLLSVLLWWSSRFSRPSLHEGGNRILNGGGLLLALCCGRICGSFAQPEYYCDDINKRKDEYDHEYEQEGVSDRDSKVGEAYDG